MTDRLHGRREFLRLTLAALAGSSASTIVVGPAAAQLTKASAKKGSAAAPGGKFFNARELATLDEIAEMIIPADDRSGGARAAKVAEFIDARLAESLDPAWRKSWRDDLAEIDRLSRLWNKGRTFVQATPEQRTRLLERISANESAPKEPGEYAFGTIKWTVAETYYRTRIGIHDEIGYMGNTILTEFIGTDVSNAPALKTK